MRSRWTIVGIALLSAVLAIGAVSCGDDDDDGNGAAATATVPADGAEATATPADGEEPTEVGVSLTEWQVLADVESAPAGSVTFTASNIGQETHELVVIRTDLEPSGLPTGDDGGVDEAGEGIEVIDEIEEFAAGGEESLTLDLEAGAYVLICNVVEEEETGEFESHYGLGMATAFEVTG
ncbi:MAG: hypothetical protein WD939_02520 [Dehalococcoidia bacterium]